MRWLDSIIDSMVMNPSKLWETVKDRGAWHAAVHGGRKESDMIVTKQQVLEITECEAPVLRSLRHMSSPFYC